ncbi:MAG: NAD(+) synthase [Firmicutes bacterium]|nr:NAD(+) synthase [Bacillota bacterium]
MSFDAAKVKDDIVQWIRDWFEINGKGCKAVVGISGGKDSSVVAALCAEALGKDNVVGVLMPNGEQFDIDVARALCDHVGIRQVEINIKDAFDGVVGQLKKKLPEVSAQTIVNLPPRLRMTALYAASQSLNGRVANTCNLSEDWVGYNTKFGDGAGDFSPLSKLTVQEVKAVGRELGLPAMFVDKVPIDGLQSKTDEDNLGFTYAALDEYIRTGVCDDPETKEKIDRKHAANKFKLEPMPTFQYTPDEPGLEW